VTAHIAPEPFSGISHTQTHTVQGICQPRARLRIRGRVKVRKERRRTRDHRGEERRKKTLGCTLDLGGQGEQMPLTVQKLIFLSLRQQPNTSNPSYSPKTAACQRQIKYKGNTLFSNCFQSSTTEVSHGIHAD